MRHAFAAEPRAAASPRVTLTAAPSVSVPLGFFVPAVVLLLAAAASLPFLAGKMADWYYQQEILAAVHTLTLGFVLAVFLGASVQLLPVVSGQMVERTGLVRAASLLFFAGAIGMVLHFYWLRWAGLLVSAALVIGAVVLFLVAVAPLLLRRERDDALLGLLLAFIGLVLTMAAGFLLGMNRRSPFLPGAPLDHLAAHLHLGLLSTFTVAIFGVESRLLPMFLITSPPGAKRQRAALFLLFGGALLLSLALWLGLPAAPFALAVLAAIALQLVNVREMLASRRRKEIDAGFLYALSAYADLVAAGLVGLAWSLGLGKGTALPIRLAWVYGFLLLVGFVVQTVVGILSKILPFVVWNATYARRVGVSPVPMLRDLSSETLQRVGFVLFRVSSVLLAIALLRGHPGELRAASAFFAVSLVPFVAHVVRVLTHLVRPLRPFPTEVPHAGSR